MGLLELLGIGSNEPQNSSRGVIRHITPPASDPVENFRRNLCREQMAARRQNPTQIPLQGLQCPNEDTLNPVDPELRSAIIDEHNSSFYGETLPGQSPLPSMRLLEGISIWNDSKIQQLCLEQSELQENNPLQMTLHSLPCVNPILRSAILQEHDSLFFGETTPLQSILPSMRAFAQLEAWTDGMIGQFCSEQNSLREANPHQLTLETLPCDND